MSAVLAPVKPYGEGPIFDKYVVIASPTWVSATDVGIGRDMKATIEYVLKKHRCRRVGIGIGIGCSVNGP